jgi:CheY-like chemotaxis protein
MYYISEFITSILFLISQHQQGRSHSCVYSETIYPIQKNYSIFTIRLLIIIICAYKTNLMGQSSKILVVDDEPVGRQLLEAILYPENFDIYYAENGAEALDKAIEIRPDLILMDVMMPEMDGFQVCRNLRKHETLGNVPIILITALDDRDSMIKGLDSGADDYISKPFDRVEVLAKVKNITQLDRYKRISPDALHYAGLVLRSLIPPADYLNRILPEHFIIMNATATSGVNTYSVSEKDNNIILLLCSMKSQDISGILINILGITLANKAILQRDTLNPKKILDDMRTAISGSEPVPDSSSGGVNDINIALCIFNRANLKLQYSGSSIPLFVISDKGSKIIEPDNSFGKAGEQAGYQNIEVSLSRNDSFYFFSNNLLGYFKEGFKKAAGIDLVALLEEQMKKNMKEQEMFFKALVDKAASTDKKLKDILLIGVRV